MGVSLSGGFASAVVVGLLRSCTNGPSVTCVNRYSDDIQSEERQFARAAARHVSVELRELPFGSGQPLLDSHALAAPKTVKPTIEYIFGLAEYNYRNGFLKELRSQALWTGQGGDHLFLQLPTT